MLHPKNIFIFFFYIFIFLPYEVAQNFSYPLSTTLHKIVLL